MNATAPLPTDIDATARLLLDGEYLAPRDLAAAVYLCLSLGRPLLLEGEAGVGKTEIANVLADTLGRRLIRLQCYEGLDLAAAAYEWDYPRQMLAIRLAEAGGRTAEIEHSLYADKYLLERPLLQSIRSQPGGAPVLLIDEIDRADEPFEAFLLELLSDFQLSIPELGTVRASEPPIVIITSNRTREVHDALRRRCLYCWVQYPDFDTEARIVALKVPGINAELRAQLVAFVQKLRDEELYKAPGIAETIDWSNALLRLNTELLGSDVVDATLGTLLKYQDDIEKIRGSRAKALLAAVEDAA